MEPWVATKKKNFQLVWRCHQLLYGFLAKGHLPQSRLLANDKGDNEMVLRAVLRFLSIYLTAEKTGKPQLGDRLMKGLCDQSLPQINVRESSY